MLLRSTLSLLLWSLPAGAVVIDRIVVIVDKLVIKSSDIDRDLRVTEFLNSQPLDLSVAAKRKAAERLIDQTIIREEMEKSAYPPASTASVDAMVKRVLPARAAELSRYGLTEAQLRMQMQWQLDVLKFIDERFRPGVLVTDDQVQAYYNEHKADLERQYPQTKTYAAMAPQIRAKMEGDQVDLNFDQWLTAARKRSRIVYRQEAFQ
jgi:hypothetical protein